MSLANKVVIFSVLTFILAGLLFLTPLRDTTFALSPLTSVLVILFLVSLVCFLIFFIKMLLTKEHET